MKTSFVPNLESEGRFVRGVSALALSIAAIVVLPLSRRLSFLLLAAGLFTLFEAMRGWCVLRACGIKTPL